MSLDDDLPGDPNYDLPGDVIAFLYDLVTDFHGWHCTAPECVAVRHKKWINGARTLLSTHYIGPKDGIGPEDET